MCVCLNSSPKMEKGVRKQGTPPPNIHLYFTRSCDMSCCQTRSWILARYCLKAYFLLSIDFPYDSQLVLNCVKWNLERSRLEGSNFTLFLHFYCHCTVKTCENSKVHLSTTNKTPYVNLINFLTGLLLLIHESRTRKKNLHFKDTIPVLVIWYSKIVMSEEWAKCCAVFGCTKAF